MLLEELFEMFDTALDASSGGTRALQEVLTETLGDDAEMQYTALEAYRGWLSERQLAAKEDLRTAGELKVLAGRLEATAEAEALENIKNYGNPN